MNTVDRANERPLVDQLKEIILEQIRVGTLVPEQRVPSERELCKIYGVSRTTARNALLDLENRGIVTRATGSGTFVSGEASPPAGSAGQTGTVGFLLCRHHFPVRSLREDFFYFEVMEGIQDELKADGRHLLFHHLAGDRSEGLVIADLAGKVDGILLAEVQSERLIDSILAADLPVILINPSVDRLKFDLNSVSIDNRAGAYKAVRHLIELGHRVIGCIQGPMDSAPARERYAGYSHALQEAGLAVRDDCVEPAANWTIEEGESAARRLIERAPEVTALFCANDTIAVGALSGLAPFRRVPDEVSIVGFDDISIASHSTPPLTTVRSPIFELGKAACRLLASARSNKSLPTTTILFSPELKVRASTKRL